MTTSQTTFYGGALHITASDGNTTYVHPENGPGVVSLTIDSGSGSSIVLPDPSKCRQALAGHEILIVYVESGVGGAVRLRKSDGLVVVRSFTSSDDGKVFKVYLRDPDGETWVVREIGDAYNDNRAMVRGNDQSINPPERVTAVTPDCLVGDICDSLADAGAQPLDGQDGRDEVVATMFFDTDHMYLDRSRTPIRAADVLMNDKIGLRFKQGTFVQDPSHPLSSSVTLSQALYDVLYNSNGYHVLEYDAQLATHTGTTHHWHHLVQSSNTSNLSLNPAAFDVTQHVWRKVKKYGPEEDPERYQFELRVVLTHTITDPAQQPDQENGGGIHNRSSSSGDYFGAWGTTVHIYAFTTESKPDWIDGVSTFEPYSYWNDDTAHPFAPTYDDPAWWGGVSDRPTSGGNTGWDDEDKHFHPHLLLAASLPTSMEVPVGRDVTYLNHPERNKRIGQQLGLNTMRDADVDNGMPWIFDRDRVKPSNQSIYRNNLFGRSTSAVDYRKAIAAMGGGAPFSEPLEFVVIENGLREFVPQGHTLLAAPAAGWDESSGRLVANTSIDIALCVGDIGDADRLTISRCDGHPAEPVGNNDGNYSGGLNFGGTPMCFKTLPGAQGKVTGTDPYSDFLCCITLNDASFAQVGEVLSGGGASVSRTDRCYEIVTKFKGEDTNGDGRCDVKCVECRPDRVYAKDLTTPMAYVDWSPLAPLARRVRWELPIADPLYKYRSADLAEIQTSGSAGDTDEDDDNIYFVSSTGTFVIVQPTLGVYAARCTANGGGSGAFRAGLEAQSQGNTQGFMGVSCTATIAEILEDGGVHALGVGEFSGNEFNGVAVSVERGDFGNGVRNRVLFAEYTAGAVVKVLRQNDINNDDDLQNVRLEITRWGVETSARATIGTNSVAVNNQYTTAHDGTGGPILLAKRVGLDVEFSEFAFTEFIPPTSNGYYSSWGQIAGGAMSAEFPSVIHPSEGICEGEITNPSCGNVPNCGCSRTAKYKTQRGSGQYDPLADGNGDIEVQADCP